MTALTCEICDKSPAREDVWTFCSDCGELYSTFLQFVKVQSVDASDLLPLKEALRSEAREIGLVR